MYIHVCIYLNNLIDIISQPFCGFYNIFYLVENQKHEDSNINIQIHKKL